MAQPASNIKLIIFFDDNFRIIRIEDGEKVGGMLKKLRALSRIRYLETKDGHSKSKCYTSQTLSVECNVHIWESLEPSL